VTAAFWPWTILEIAPTEDRKAVREAYARLLKALDHEAQTDDYMALREARDGALSGEFLHPPRDDFAEEEDDFGLGTPLADDGVDAASPGIEPLAEPAPQEKPVFTVDYDDEDDRRFARTVELFTGEGALTAGETGELHELLDHLLGDDRMGDLGHYARVEGWLAQLLAERFPRGEALFPRVADHFHWASRVHELGIHPAIPWLFNAHDGYSRARELNTPGHAYHREWNELARGKIAGPLWLRRVDNGRMANLINTIRRDYAWLEQEHWQPELVARWEKRVAGGGVSGPNPWVWIVAVVMFLGAIGRVLDDGRSPSSRLVSPEIAGPTAEEQAKEAVAGFLERNFPDAVAQGRTMETLATKNPKIHDKLVQHARYLPDDKTLADNILMKDLTDGYFLIIHQLPFDRQRADAGFRAAALKRLQNDPQGCLDFIIEPARYARSGNAPLILTDAYRNHIFTVVHDDYKGVAFTFPQRNYTLDGGLVEKLMERSGLSEKRLRAAIASENSSNADVCRARASLLEIMTEIPRKQSEKILPALL